MNVLALEPWYGGSHRQFLDGLSRHSRHHWRSVSLPGRYWRWRMEMGAVPLAEEARALCAEGIVPDVIFASDMTNLPAFQSLTRSCMGDIPVVLYFHENQLTYPLPEGRKRRRAYWQINFLSALAADHVVFNSRFHREEFLHALGEELGSFPDFQPLNALEEIREKSEVLHVGLDLETSGHEAGILGAQRTTGQPRVILRNQRWDYDKNPQGFLALIDRLDRNGYDFELILTGRGAEARNLEPAWERHSERIIHRGFVENKEQYKELLKQADIVVSTADHEFFGVAVMEAIHHGCHPLLPNRLSYPELIPEALHRPLLHASVLYEDEDELYKIAAALLGGAERPLPPATLRQITEAYRWETVIDSYDDMLYAWQQDPK